MVRSLPVIRLLKVGFLYFACVFAAGFSLGVVRTLWVEPALGARIAQLIEAPIMLLVVALAARTIVRRQTDLVRKTHWLGVGMIALAFLLAIEFTVVLRLRNLSLSEYFATQDPVAGSVYYALLGAFAVMPLLMFSRRSTDPGAGLP